jgi:hypothetical protein
MPVDPNDFEPVGQPVNPSDFEPVQAAAQTQPQAVTQSAPVDPNDFEPVPSGQPTTATQSATATQPNNLDFSPADLDGVRFSESSNGKNLVSYHTNPDGTKTPIAFGPYQFTKSTAQTLGLEDPMDEDTSRATAASYLNSMAQEFGSKDLALAGYNWGPNNIRKLIAKYGQQDAFSHVPQDVQAYVNKVDAYSTKVASSAPAQQGVNPDDFEPYAAPAAPTTPQDTGIFSKIGALSDKAGDVGAGLVSSIVGGMSGFGSQLGYLGEHLLMNPVQSGLPTLSGLEKAGEIGNTVTNYLNQRIQLGASGKEAQAELGNVFSYVNKPTDWLGDTVTKAGDPNTGAWIKAAGPLVTQSVVGWLLPKGLGGVRDIVKGKVDSTVEFAKTGEGIPIDRTQKNPDGSGMIVPTITADELAKTVRENKPVNPAQGELDLSQPEEPTAPAEPTVPIQKTPEMPKSEPAPLPPPTQEGANVLGMLSEHTEPEVTAKPEEVPAQSVAEAEQADEAPQAAAEASQKPVEPAQAAPATEEATSGTKPFLTPQEEAILETAKSQDLIVQRGNFEVGDSVKLTDGRWGTLQELPDNGGKAIVEMGNGPISVLPTQLEFRVKTVLTPKNAEAPAKAPTVSEVEKAVPEENKGVGTETPGPFPRLGYNQRGSIPMNWTKPIADGLKSILNFKLGSGPVRPPTSVFYTPAEITSTLYRVFRNSTDIDDFKTMLGNELERNTALPKAIGEVMDQIYQHFQEGKIPKNDPYFNLTEFQQRAANSAMPYDMIRPSWGKLDQAKDDIAPTRETFLPSEYLGSLKWERAGTKIMKWTIDSARVFNDMANYMAKQYLGFSDFFNKLARPSKLGVFQAMHDWDLGGKFNQMLIDGKQWYPTIEQLMENSKLNKVEAVAYDSIAKGYQAMFKLMRGVDQIPGYMPHMWHGAWKFQVIDHDGSLLAVNRSTTRYAANSAAKTWREKGYNTTPVEAPLEISKSDASKALFQAASLFQKQKGLDLAVRNSIARIQQRIAEGTVYESMERHGIKGYTGADGVLPESGQGVYRNLRNRWENNRGLNVYQHYVHDIVTGWKNQHIIEKVLAPISSDATLDDLTNTKKAVEDIIQKGVGLSKTEMDALDKAMNHFLVGVGGSPEIPRRTVIALNAMTRLKTINSLNIKFAAQHLLFSLFSLPNLALEHADLFIRGEKTGNLMGAASRYMQTIVPGSWRLYDEVAQKARDRFENDGLETHMYEETSTGLRIVDAMKHGLLNVMVNYARRATFDTHFQYYREYMSPEQAYQASKKATNKVMQSFDPLDRPGISSEGNIGRLFSPFNQIHFYNLGRLLSSTESIGAGVKASMKTGNPKFAAAGMAPVLTLVGTGLAISGTRSLPLQETYNHLARWADEQFGYTFPSVDTLMKEHAFPDWMTLGGVSKALNTDLSGTFEGFDPTTMLSPTSFGFATNLGEFLMQEILQYTRGHASPLAKQAALKRLLPSPLNSLFTHYLAEQNNGVILNSKGQPTYRQTQAEYHRDLILGGKSYTEAQKQLSDEVQKELSITQQNRAEAIKKAIIEKELNKKSKNPVSKEFFNPGSFNEDKLTHQGMQEHVGLNPNEIAPEIQKTFETRQHTQKENLRLQIQKAQAAGDQIQVDKLAREYKTAYGNSPK